MSCRVFTRFAALRVRSCTTTSISWTADGQWMKIRIAIGSKISPKRKTAHGSCADILTPRAAETWRDALHFKPSGLTHWRLFHFLAEMNRLLFVLPVCRIVAYLGVARRVPQRPP